MAANDNSSMFDALVGEILAMAGETAPQRSLARDFKAAAERDCEPRLARHFSKKEMRAMLAPYRMSLRTLNRQQFTLNSLPDPASFTT